MNSRRIAQRNRFSVVASVVAAVGLAAFGCNTILDNEPAGLDPKRTTSSQPTDPDSDSDSDVAHVGAGDDGSAPPTEQPDDRCPAGQQWCHGQCVSDDDPTYGCGSAACTPCASAHGTAACQNKACVIQACNPGFADCNTLATDGCEADLSLASSCGACGAACPATAPVCAPSGPSFQCATGCPLGAPLRCGNECVSPLSSVNHCGGCDGKCAEVEHADVSCSVGSCVTTCKPSYHLCAGACVVETDATACGAGCVVCPPAANAVPTCQAEACGFACNAGFGNCNIEPADGCESNLTNDPLNCGACGRSCNGGACNGGICAPAPDAGP